MIDETPYIIVDNQKLSPIGRSPRSGSATGDTAKREEQTFGVVDRVTLSREGREKSMQKPVHTEAVTDLKNLPTRAADTVTDLLTYSPKKSR